MKKSGMFSKIKLLQVTLVAASLILLMAFAPSRQNAEEGWVLLTSESGINAYAMKSECSGSSKYLIKIENTSSEISSFKLTYELKGSQAYGPRTDSFILNPLENKEGSCKSGKLLVLPDYENTSGNILDRVKIEIYKN